MVRKMCMALASNEAVLSRYLICISFEENAAKVSRMIESSVSIEAPFNGSSPRSRTRVPSTLWRLVDMRSLESESTFLGRRPKLDVALVSTRGQVHAKDNTHHRQAELERSRVKVLTLDDVSVPGPSKASGSPPFPPAWKTTLAGIDEI